MIKKTYQVDKIKLQNNQKTKEVSTLDVLRGCKLCELSSICYAKKGAGRTNIDFSQIVKREYNENLLRRQLENYSYNWVRVGCISDPSLDWNITAKICLLLKEYNKIPVVITKFHKPLETYQRAIFHNSNTILHVSTSALATKKIISGRENILRKCIKDNINCVSRINSAAFIKNKRLYKQQEELIHLANNYNKIPILETPIRLFKTSNIWNLVDQNQYHRHLSPISGNLDSQRTAGLIIENAYPCYSSCATPDKINPELKHADNGCENQCMTDFF